MEYIKEAEILLYETLCSKSITEDVKEAHIRFKENIKLANSIIYKMPLPRDSAIDKEDIMQAGYLGLWKACLGFDESLGFAFSTYAVPVIKGEILRLLRESSSIHIPRKFYDISIAINKHKFTAPLTSDQIEILVSEGFKREDVIECTGLRIDSLDASFLEDDHSLNDILGIEDPLELSDEELEIIIDDLVSYIDNDNYKDIIEEWLYAELAGDKIPQVELAKKYGISQSYINRILKQGKKWILNHKEEVLKNLGS